MYEYTRLYELLVFPPRVSLNKMCVQSVFEIYPKYARVYDHKIERSEPKRYRAKVMYTAIMCQDTTDLGRCATAADSKAPIKRGPGRVISGD